MTEQNTTSDNIFKVEKNEEENQSDSENNQKGIKIRNRFKDSGGKNYTHDSNWSDFSDDEGGRAVKLLEELGSIGIVSGGEEEGQGCCDGLDCDNPGSHDICADGGEKISNWGDLGEYSHGKVASAGLNEGMITENDTLVMNQWVRSRVGTELEVEDGWRSENIWLSERSGVRWLRRIHEEGLILQYQFNMFTDLSAAEDAKFQKCGISVIEVLSRAAQNSGHELKWVRRRPGRGREERQIVSAKDDSIRLIWMQEENLVKVKKRLVPLALRAVVYKDVLKVKATTKQLVWGSEPKQNMTVL